jgi:cytochrome c5
MAACLGACAGAEIPAPSVIDANRSGVALERLDRGRTVYLDKCTRCHTPIAPRDYSSGDWPGHVDEMTDRSKISHEEKELILAYLTTMSAPAK